MNRENQIKKSERVRLCFAETARDIIKKDGIGAVSIRKVAAEAGYSFATMYNHFKSLDELLWYARSIMIRDVSEHLGKTGCGEVTGSKDVKKLFRAYIDYFVANPNIYRFFYFHHLERSEKTTASLVETDEHKEQLVHTFDYLLKSGRYTPEKIAVVLKTILYSVHGLLTLIISDNDELSEDEAYNELESIIELLLG